MALVFGREDSGLTNEELEQVDLLTGIPMANDYPSLNLGQAVMVYCYQLSKLNQVEAPLTAAADGQQLQALRQRLHQLLAQLEVSDDEKLSDWIDQRLGLLEQRDTAMLHRLLHDIEKNSQINPRRKSDFAVTDRREVQHRKRSKSVLRFRRWLCAVRETGPPDKSG